MGRLWKKINEDTLTENDLMSLAKCHNVSVYRKERFKKYDTITFRCSQYRRFTKCQYQVKAKVFHDGIYQIFCSCKFGLKEYSCIHTTGLMMIWGVRTIPQLIGKRNVKGRRKKAKHALSKE